MMTAMRLLKSCATPPARRPTDSSRWACALRGGLVIQALAREEIGHITLAVDLDRAVDWIVPPLAKIPRHDLLGLRERAVHRGRDFDRSHRTPEGRC